MTRTRAGRRLFWVPVLLVGALLATALVVDRYQVDVPFVGPAEPDPVREPAAVAPPPGLDMPALRPAPAPARALDTGGRVLPGRVRAAVARLARDRDLGRSVAVSVGAVGRAPAWSTGPRLVTPASTMKLLTTTAALAALGPDARFTTRVVRAPKRGARGARDGRGVPALTLVGGGDPLLASRPVPDDPSLTLYPARADVVTLARRTVADLAAAPGPTPRRVSLRYDDSVFSGPVASSAWERDYLPGEVVAPIGGLWVDEGRPPSGYGRVADPARAAAQAYADALAARGVDVEGRPRPARAPRGGAEVAAVDSAPLSEIVTHVLDVSDNEGAEVLAHQVGLAVSGDGSFEGGARAVRRVLERLGVDLGGARIFDGSGLARGDLLPVQTLRDVLGVAASAQHPELRAVVTGLPVAGFTGSLAYRFDTGAPAGLGLVRAKTGTLTEAGVHGLAGFAVDANGMPLSFVAVADQVALPHTLDARDLLDDVAAALAACRCSR